MHVLIATTGVLSPEPAVDFTSALLGTDGRVTVTTVIEVPRSFLEDITSQDWHPFTEMQTPPDAEQQETLIARYVEERGRKLTDPIVAALRAASIDSTTRFMEGADPAAAISALADESDADIVILGATRQIFDQSAWESVSARIMIESGRPVLVVPPSHHDKHDKNGKAAPQESTAPTDEPDSSSD